MFAKDKVDLLEKIDNYIRKKLKNFSFFYQKGIEIFSKMVYYISKSGEKCHEMLKSGRFFPIFDERSGHYAYR